MAMEIEVAREHPAQEAMPPETVKQEAMASASEPGSGFGKGLVLTVLLTLALGVAILASLATGAVRISPRAILAAMLGQHPLTEMQRLILFRLRLPRVLASGVVGAALSVAGLLFQGLFRNPIADPYVIGSSGGAIFGACIGIAFFSQWSVFGFSATALLAFVGSAATMALVYSLARSAGKTNVVTLLLAGFAISTMFTNTTYFFEIFDKSGNGNRILISWLHGVIGIPAWTELAVSACLLALATLASLPLMRTLNTLALGDEYAQQLGVRVESARVCIILIGSLLTAVAVTLGGMISFAGLIVPHVGRLLLGPDHVRLLPVTALGGAIFLILADTVARTIFAPSEVPVGIIMAFVGAPFFLYLLRKMKRGYTV
jgi:iron complex transport system permease protein